MATPTCPANNNYKQEYLAIKYDYDTKCSMDPQVLENYIDILDTKVSSYENPVGNSSTATTTASATELSNAFQPISQYYSNLVSIRERLNVFLECSTNHLQDNSSGPSLNEERYSNRANPQDTVMPRELVFGLFSQLRPSSVPIVMAAGVFMSCLALLIIFQMFGFTGEIHAPPALIQAYGSIGAAAATPLYQNPMALSGISIVLGVGVIILGVMYYRSKK